MKIQKLLFGVMALSLTASCIEVDETIVNSSSSGTTTTDVNAIVFDSNNLQGNIGAGQTATLDATKTYILTGPLLVRSGGKLIIPAGTQIKATAGRTDTYVAITQGGLIDARGTASSPIVFTSNSATPSRGDWGGILILGKAPINQSGGTAQAEVTGLTYGGSDASDNSGIFQYVQINYSGAKINSEKEFNGLSMYGVGSATVIDHVEVYKGNDDAFEWFGGTNSCLNLIALACDDDMFDWTDGWVGTLSEAYGKHDSDTGNRGIEADNLTANPLATPISNPTLRNITLIGRNGGSENEGAHFRVGSKVQGYNILMSNWGKGVVANGAESIGYFSTSPYLSKITAIKFDAVTTQIDPSTIPVGSSGSITLVDNTGAGNGTSKPTWAEGWTIGFK